MTMRSVKMKPVHLQKIAQLHRGEIQLPQYIQEWNDSIADKREIVVAMMAQQVHPAELITRCRLGLTMMMQRKDMLYLRWLEGEEHKTWNDLRAERPPSAEDLFKYTVADTEDYLNGPGAAAFALFLEEQWPGFLKDLAHACLRDCDPLLNEGIEITAEVRSMFSYPETFFGTKNRELIEHRLAQWALAKGLEDKPSYVQRLIIANMNVARGNTFGAFEDMEFARCEAAEPDFHALMKAKDPKCDEYILASQRWVIEQMLAQWPTS